jgi:hypothetical protein
VLRKTSLSSQQHDEENRHRLTCILYRASGMFGLRSVALHPSALCQSGPGFFNLVWYLISAQIVGVSIPGGLLPAMTDANEHDLAVIKLGPTGRVIGTFKILLCRFNPRQPLLMAHSEIWQQVYTPL